MPQPPHAEYEFITSLFVNLGFGGAVVACLVWFLMYLVKVSLPKQQEDFLAALREERAQRLVDADKVVAQMSKLIRAVRRNQGVLMDRIDVSFKQLVAEVQAARDRPHGPPPGPPP